MKRLLPILAVGLFLLTYGSAYALSTFITSQGGTGTSTPSGILYGDNGATSHLNTVTIGSNCTFVGGTLNCTGIGSPYPFPLAGNATSTLTQFNGGLTSYASSTIGAGAQATGLTISGGATTTLNAYFANKVGISTTSPTNLLSVGDDGTYSAYFSGRVGIGKSTPAVPLEVNGEIRSSQSGASTLQLYSSASGGFVGIVSGAQLNITAASFRPSTNGTIALGDSTHYWSSISVHGFTLSPGDLMQAGSTNSIELYNAGTGAMNLTADYAGAAAGGINFAAGGLGTKLRVDKSGSVGVATTSPFGALSVGGSAYIGGNLTATGTVQLSQLSTGLMFDANGLVGAQATTSASTAYGSVWRDANQNAFAQNFVSAGTSFPTNGATVTLTAASPRNWIFTGTQTQTAKLPNGTTLTVGAQYLFNNNSTGLVTIVDNGSNQLTTVLSGGSRLFTITDNSTSNGSWDTHGYLGHKVYSGYNSLAIGSSSPSAELSVHANANDSVPYTTLFAIGSSTAAATSTLLSVSNKGQITGTQASTTKQGVISPIHYLHMPEATTTAWTATTSGAYVIQSQITAPFNGTLLGGRCYTDTGTLNVDTSIGSTHLTMQSITSTPTAFTFSSSNTFTVGQIIQQVSGTPASSPSYKDCELEVTETPQ